MTEVQISTHADFDLTGNSLLHRWYPWNRHDGRDARCLGDSIAVSAPLRRIGRDDDMAGIAVFLASRAGSYLTGAIIPVDGGIATTACGSSG